MTGRAPTGRPFTGSAMPGSAMPGSACTRLSGCAPDAPVLDSTGPTIGRSLATDVSSGEAVTSKPPYGDVPPAAIPASPEADAAPLDHTEIGMPPTSVDALPLAITPPSGVVCASADAETEPPDCAGFAAWIPACRPTDGTAAAPAWLVTAVARCGAGSIGATAVGDVTPRTTFVRRPVVLPSRPPSESALTT